MFFKQRDIDRWIGARKAIFIEALDIFYQAQALIDRLPNVTEKEQKKKDRCNEYLFLEKCRVAKGVDFCDAPTVMHYDLILDEQGLDAKNDGHKIEVGGKTYQFSTMGRGNDGPQPEHLFSGSFMSLARFEAHALGDDYLQAQKSLHSWLDDVVIAELVLGVGLAFYGAFIGLIALAGIGLATVFLAQYEDSAHKQLKADLNQGKIPGMSQAEINQALFGQDEIPESYEAYVAMQEAKEEGLEI